MGKESERCKNRHGKSQVFFFFHAFSPWTIYTATPQSILGSHQWIQGSESLRHMELDDDFRGFNMNHQHEPVEDAEPLGSNPQSLFLPKPSA